MAVRDLAISRGASTLIFDPNIIIEVPEYNTRDMESESTIQHIREMANFIIENGNDAFPPIRIHQENDKVVLIEGWCRRRAHVLAMSEGAPIKGILCLTSTKRKPDEVTLNILSSNDGLPLTAIEKAKAIKKLQSFLWTPADIAKKTGWSLSHIQNLITLHDSPDAILDMVKDGKVSATLATKLVKSKGAEEAQKELESAIETSTKAGRKKATQGDLDRVKTASVSWKTQGPKCYALLKAIYETPATQKDSLWKRISEAGELLGEIEEKMGRDMGD
jgi:ParB family chromosome partitioning protein